MTRDSMSTAGIASGIRFDDGAAYEGMMGIWSRLAGGIFLDWLAPPSGLRWVDIGCGNGAFTELLVERCTPAEVRGIDPSEAQLAFARARPAAHMARFLRGDAMALPFAAGTFDIAVMALVLVFVPDPAKGVEEMARVVRSGGIVASYTWDMLGGGFPLDPILTELRAIDRAPPRPPRMETSRMQALQDAWTDAGFLSVETRAITVQRSFAHFDEFWTASSGAPSIAPTVSALTRADVEALKERVRARVSADADGRITCAARANAIKGRRA